MEFLFLLTYILHPTLPIVDARHALLFHLVIVAVPLVSLRLVAIVFAGVNLLLRVDFVIITSARVALETHCDPYEVFNL